MKLTLLTSLVIVLVPVLALSVLTAAGRLMNRRVETVARAEEAIGPGTRFVATRSGRVHVLDVGDGEDVILLLHGTGRSVADWQEGLAERLAEALEAFVAGQLILADSGDVRRGREVRDETIGF